MKLRRSIVAKFRYATEKPIKVFIVTLVVTSFMAGSTLIYQYVADTQTASAATPVDTCFDFDEGTGTIMNYYDNEDNDPGNPACPRDVDIPGTIESVTVIAVNDSAFNAKSLTTVSILNTVTSIG